MDDELKYTEDNHPVFSIDLNNFVGIVPIRELEDNEEIDDICKVMDERTGIWHIGFIIKKWDTASLFTIEWIGSKSAQSAQESVLDILNKEIEYLTGGDEMKSMNESVTDSSIVTVLKKIKKKLE